jgi:hypothetical protein
VHQGDCRLNGCGHFFYCFITFTCEKSWICFSCTNVIRKYENVRYLNTQTFSRNNCYNGKTINITYSEYLFLELGIQQAMRMNHIVICVSPVYKLFSTLSHKRHDYLKSYFSLNVFIYNFSWRFLILGITERATLIVICRFAPK